MILIDRQSIEDIENHLSQLYKELKTSKNIKVLEDIIDFWELELIFKKHKLDSRNRRNDSCCTTLH